MRVSFSEMHLALARGDIDAYVGAEPGPGVSLVDRRRQARRISLRTAMGSLNMVFGTHRDTLAEKPDLVSVMLGIHRKASDFAMPTTGRDGRDGGRASSARRRKRSKPRCPMSN